MAGPLTPKFVQINTMLITAKSKFEAWLSSAARAYEDAWNRHTKFLSGPNGIGQQAKIPENLILQAALAFFPGVVAGAFGDIAKIAYAVDKSGKALAVMEKDSFWQGALRSTAPQLANTMANLQLGAAKTDGVKDLIKGVARGQALPALAGMTSWQVSADKAYSNFPTSPLSWQNAIGGAVAWEFSILGSIVLQWEQGNVPKYPGFDPITVISDALRVSVDDPVLNNLAPPISIFDLVPLNSDQRNQLSTEFEKGFLVGWLGTSINSAFDASGGELAWVASGTGRSIISYGQSLGLVDTEKAMRFAYDNNYRGVFTPPHMLFGPGTTQLQLDLLRKPYWWRDYK
jgi:hypothetical protein